MNSSSVRWLRIVKCEEAVIHSQNNSVNEVETPPVPSNLCTLLIYVSTAVWNSHKDSVREAAVKVKVQGF